MIFKIETFKSPEIIALRVALTFAMAMSCNGYIMDTKEKKDSNVEQWLSGKLKVFDTYEDAAKYLKDLEDIKTKQKGGYIV